MPHTSIEWEVPCVVEIDWNPGDPGCSDPDSPMCRPPEPFSWQITRIMVGDQDVIEKLTRDQLDQFYKQIDAYRRGVDEAMDF